MLIRRAENKDIPTIHELLIQVCMVHHVGRPDLFKKGARKYSDEQLIKLLADDTRPVFVAVDDAGTVAGYVFCVFEEHINDNVLCDMKTLYIDDLCVDENRRGQHIGKQLYDYAVAYAREHGCYNLTLNVWSKNPAAMKFYESCGLVPQKIHMETIL